LDPGLRLACAGSHGRQWRAWRS